MKRIAPLVVALSVIVSCQRSNDDDVVPSFKSTDPQSQSEVLEPHVGSAELVVKTELDGVKTMAFASGINSLLVSDGTIIGEQGIDLEILSLTDLKRTGEFKITDEMSDNYPWSSCSLTIAPNGSNALLYNQYIDLNTLKPTIALDIQPVIGRPNVCPEPWSISPNSKQALVCVGSYWSQDESTLATFDLATGKFLKKLSAGRNTEYGCACFLDNESVASIGYDGVVTIHNLADSTTQTFSKKITQGIQDGRNLRLQPFDGGRKLVVAGDNEVFVLDIPQLTVLFRRPCNNCNGIVTDDGKLLLWQNGRRTNQTVIQNKLMFKLENVLFVANAQTGDIVGEYILPTFYHMMVMDNASEFIFAAHYNELHKLKIDLSPIANK